MIVQLTHYQARVVMTRVPWQYAEAMADHRVPHGPKAHAYDLPAIAWRQIRDFLYLNPAYYGPLGGKLDTQPHALYRAIQLIHQKVLEMEHHPALTGEAVLGTQMNVIPAWGLSPPRSPYPDMAAGLFVLLVPDWIERHGQQLTRWRQTTDPALIAQPSWTYSPEAHLRFAGVLPLPQL